MVKQITYAIWEEWYHSIFCLNSFNILPFLTCILTLTIFRDRFKWLMVFALWKSRYIAFLGNRKCLIFNPLSAIMSSPSSITCRSTNLFFSQTDWPDIEPLNSDQKFESIVTYLTQFRWNLIKVFVLTIDRPSSILCHIEPNTWTPGQKLAKSCGHLSPHFTKF